MKTLILLGLTLLAVCVAYAIPTLTGPSGGLEIPTAIVTDGITVAADQDTWNGTMYPLFSVSWGAIDRLEIGGNYARSAQFFNQTNGSVTPPNNCWDVNAKYQLMNVRGVKMAIGALYGELINANMNAQGENGAVFAHQYDIYLAETVRVGKGVTASANIGYGKNVDADRSGMNGGVALEKALSKKTSFGAEWIVGDHTAVYGSFVGNAVPIAGLNHGNLYLTHEIDKNFSARVAIGGMGQADQFVVGAAYTFPQ